MTRFTIGKRSGAPLINSKIEYHQPETRSKNPGFTVGAELSVKPLCTGAEASSNNGLLSAEASLAAESLSAKKIKVVNTVAVKVAVRLGGVCVAANSWVGVRVLVVEI